MAVQKLSSIASFASRSGDMTFHLGIDVHKRSYSCALRREDGELKTWVANADPDELAYNLTQLGCQIILIAYETGPCGFALHRTLTEAGFRTIVVGANKIPRQGRPSAKNDRLDCSKLAEYAQMGLLTGVAVPTRIQEAERALVRRRAQLVEEMRKTKQRIRSFLLFHSFPEPTGIENWSIAALKALQSVKIQVELRVVLDSHLSELKYFQSQKVVLEKELKKVLHKQENQEVADYLQSVPGVGPVVAAAFRLELYAPERFVRAEEVSSFTGLAPMVQHSGEGKPKGWLMPVGQTMLRSLLIQAAWRWVSNDAGAKAQYKRIVRNTGLSQKAIVAMARRLATILWRLSVERRPYKLQTC